MISRRNLLLSAAFFSSRAAAVVDSASGWDGAVIDTHTHFYDPKRPQGVPWPPPEDKVLDRQVLPPEFVKLTRPLGVRGAVVIEASPWAEDNHWLLDLADMHPVIVAVVGNVPPGANGFRQRLANLIVHPLFRGIRLHQTAIRSGLGDRGFRRDLAQVADLGLTVDCLGAGPMLPDLVRLSDLLPGLRLVIDHLPFSDSAHEAALQELGRRPFVYAKMSNAAAIRNVKARLSRIWNWFGPERVLYGSNWPVSDHVAAYARVFDIVRAFTRELGPEVAAKFFFSNSKSAYRWVARA